MKIHVLPGSPNCQKVLATAEHLSLKPKVLEMQLFGPEFQTNNFLALNPNAKTPVLQDGATTLWESNAICAHLAENHAKRHDLLPSDSRAEVLQWLFWETSHYNQAYGTIAWESVIKPALLKQEPDKRALAGATENFQKYAAVLDGHLDSRTYMVGADWTIADYSVGALEKFMEAVNIDFDKYPNIRSFYERLRENPHWAATRMSLDSLKGAG